MPAVAEVDGEAFAVADWGPGGCAFQGGGPVAGSEMLEIRLHLQWEGKSYAAELTARAVRRDGKRVMAVAFEPERQAVALLEELTARWLYGLGPAGQVQPGTDVVVFGSPPAPPALPPALRSIPLPELPRLSMVARLRRSALVGLGLCLVMLIFALVVAGRTTVASDYAAVSGDLQVVRAPVEGVLAGSVLQASAMVEAGAVIGRLKPVVTPTALATARSALDAAQAKVDQQVAYLGSLRSGYGGFVTYAEHTLADATTARRAMDDQISAEQRVYDRLRALANTGTVAPLRADQELVNLRTQQHALMLAQSDEAAARQRLDDARRGRFITDGRSTQLAPVDVERDLRVMVTTRDSAAAALAALKAETVLVSPCRCRVTSVLVPDQTFVQPGNPIANLAVLTPGKVQIDALVPSGLMSFLHGGQSGQVYLSDRSVPVTATIVSLNYNPANNGRVGLPDTLRTINNYGLVTLALPSDAGDLPAGTPALVHLAVDWSSLVHHLPGLDTIRRLF